MPSRIEDYALIGDCQTAALVARDGSIDWLCWPRFDSAACFAALLGGPEHGRWQIAPLDPAARIQRRYVPGTLILETEFTTGDGVVRVVDFMPMRSTVSDLIRLVVGVRGRVDMRMEFILRFDYGTSVPWVTQLPDGGGVRAIAGPDLVVLRTPVALRGVDRTTVSEFSVGAGETVPFVLTYSASHAKLPKAIDSARALQSTKEGWARWSRTCELQGPWAEAARRSLVTLKALTYAPTGGIVAAPTTSLPEQAGGVRNWDYRYCWLRDATLALLALMNAGYYEEASAWRTWLERAVAGSPEQAQIMYGIAGERRLPELELPWLPGYEGARPVRIGNAAAAQLQLDVYGEVMDALHQARKGKIGPDDYVWAVQRKFVEHLESIWHLPDQGMWEVRGEPQHFTASKVMAWVAFDRAVKGVEMFGLPGPVERWRAVCDAIHEEVCSKGYDARRASFVQSYGSTALDAGLLLIPLTGFLPAGDARVRNTVAAIERELTIDGLVKRYHTAQTDDGLPEGEGVFLPCSFWLADNLVLQQRYDEARALFERLLSLRNDVGLLSEEYDPASRRMMGNFPQAFSHIALVNTALNLTRAVNPATQRGREQSPPGDGAGAGPGTAAGGSQASS
jgi:GH15 family glucan-1,4-alpha-glucosidase